MSHRTFRCNTAPGFCPFAAAFPEKLARRLFLFAVLFTNWLGFFSLALWENRQAAASASKIRNLATSGVYSLVRHPIYFADIGFAFGIFLFFPNLNVLLAVLFVSLLLCRWALFEEAALAEKFGKRYADYCGKVPRFLPRTV